MKEGIFKKDLHCLLFHVVLAVAQITYMPHFIDGVICSYPPKSAGLHVSNASRF